MPPKTEDAREEGRLGDGEIKKLFREIQKSGSGTGTVRAVKGQRINYISVHDVLKYAQEKTHPLGLIHTKDECEEFIHAADKDGDGLLSFDEFEKWIREREDFLINLFSNLDDNHDGFITAEELQTYYATKCNKLITMKEAEELIHVLAATIPGGHGSIVDGMLELGEFRAGLLFSTAKDDIEILHIFEHAAIFYHDGPTPPAFRSLLAGLIAGAMSRTLTAPFDRASVILRAGSGLAANGAPPSFLGIIKTMVQKEGVLSMWRGNGLNCLQVGPESALLFFLYNAIKDRFALNKDSPTVTEKFCVGGVAGFLAMTAVYPLYVAQNRMALAEKGRFKGVRDFFNTTYKVDGIKAFSSGYLSSSIRIFPLKGIDMMGYFALKEFFVKQGEQATVAQSMSFGAISTFLSQFLTFPLLTIRTKLMTQAPSLGRPIIYSGIVDCFQKVVAAEGWKGLYRGHTAQQFKFMPASAIQFTVFEAASTLLKQYII